MMSTPAADKRKYEPLVRSIWYVEVLMNSTKGSQSGGNFFDSAA
jgi:hypothetical protein